jgi:hypothetical protein
MSASPVRERVGRRIRVFQAGEGYSSDVLFLCMGKAGEKKQRERDGVSILSRCFIGSNEPSPGYP